MPAVHRVGDPRSSGGVTVGGASTVLVNGVPVALEGDSYTFGGGLLAASNTSTIFAEGRRIVLQGSVATPGFPAHQDPRHANPIASGGSPNVIARG